MPIGASAGTLDIENATLRSNAIAVLTNLVAGNDQVRQSGPPALEVYGDPSHGGNEARVELVSNITDTVSNSFTRLTSNAGVFSIETGTSGTSDNGTITFGGFSNERLRITSDGNVGVGTTNPSDKLHIYGSPMIQHDTVYDFTNNQGWYKIGVWDPTSNTGSRLKIKFLGMEGFSSQGIARGGETILYASCNNNIPDTKANIDGRIHAYGDPAITEVKFVHLDGSRHKFEIRAYIKTFVQMSMTVECTQTESFTKDVTASTDPGVESATVSHALFTHVVDNSGNMGVGMTSPTRMLHTKGEVVVGTDADNFTNQKGALYFIRGIGRANSGFGDRHHYISTRTDGPSNNGNGNNMTFHIDDGTTTTGTSHTTPLKLTGGGGVQIGVSGTNVKNQVYKRVTVGPATSGTNYALGVGFTYGFTASSTDKLVITATAMNAGNYSDTIGLTINNISTTGAEINAVRIDATTGWGQQLITGVHIVELF